MFDLKKIKVFGKDETPAIDITTQENREANPKEDKIGDLKSLVDEITNRKTKPKKSLMVEKLNHIISKYWANEEYF